MSGYIYLSAAGKPRTYLILVGGARTCKTGISFCTNVRAKEVHVSLDPPRRRYNATVIIAGGDA